MDVVDFDGVSVGDVLRDFHLRVSAGETVALMGPTGSGVCAALDVLAGFVAPTSGVLRISGRDITDTPSGRRGIGVVARSYALFPHMRVAQNVAFGLRAHRMSRADIRPRVAEVLAMVGMGAHGRYWPHELSLVQQLRVALARALAPRPVALLLGEPLDALAPALRPGMVVELQRLKEQLPDIAVLYGTRDRTEALALSDRTVVMSDGRTVAAGATDRLWKRPPTAFTAAVLGAANLIPCTVRRVIGRSALVTVSHKTVCAEAPRPGCGHADWAPGSPALLCIRPHDLRIVSLGDRDALRASVNTTVWGGATTRLMLSLTSLPSQPLEVDVPGHVRFEVGAEVGVRIPEPAGVLVPI